MKKILCGASCNVRMRNIPIHMVFTAVKTGIRTAAGNMADMKTGVPVRGVCGELLIIPLFAIYYNLYRIAEDNPEMVSYLDADGYLERAYRTAMAYFEVPYNILMGKQWAFMVGRTGPINKVIFMSDICWILQCPATER